MKNHLLLLAGSLLLSATLLATTQKIIYYPNGNKHFEYESNNAIMDGSFTGFYENGKMKIKGQFASNQKTGLWTVWDQNGTMRSQRKYADNYSFEIVKEWDSVGNLIDAAITQQKNKRLLEARAKGNIVDRSIQYMQRYFKEIPAGNQENKFLFDSNLFFNFLMGQADKKMLQAFKDDRFVTINTDLTQLQSYRQGTVVSYIIKEDLLYTNDHQAMQTRAIGICPVVEMNGAKQEVGWFYIPDVRSRRDANDRIEDIITRLEQHNFSGTVVKTTVNAGTWEIRAIAAGESDAVSLSPLDFEAGAWIYSIDKYRAS